MNILKVEKCNENNLLVTKYLYFKSIADTSSYKYHYLLEYYSYIITMIKNNSLTIEKKKNTYEAC